MPATPGRLRAQWRQVDTENREAIAVRRQWMTLLGCDEQEINESVAGDSDFELVEELSQLRAVIALSQRCRNLFEGEQK
jgi:hypothetical protein